MSHYCPNCRALCEDNLKYCPQCGAAQNQLMAEEQPMKWYKFIIYVQLFATAAVNALSGIVALTGQIYDEEIYFRVSGLRFVDLLYGIALLAVAVYAIAVRKQLKNFHRNGPAAYIKLLIAICAVGIVYSVLANVLIMSTSLRQYYQPDYSSVISSLVTTVFWVIVNKNYFGKRAHLFVNM